MSTPQPSLNTKVPPHHLTYFTFADNAVILCFHTVAISFYTRILYCYYFKRNKLKTSSMAKSLLIFLWTHLICAISDVPYHTYVVVKWNPANQENYDPYVLYWTGISVSIYYNLTSLSVLLLSLDRLLTLREILSITVVCGIIENLVCTKSATLDYNTKSIDKRILSMDIPLGEQKGKSAQIRCVQQCWTNIDRANHSKYRIFRYLYLVYTSEKGQSSDDLGRLSFSN
ncbi:hypothetical protein DdX_19936 [Ditylenchus destructor]|uniref:Uncharacterized protein n=1 Tax=Ditylenchus destructor TaxID=166010 RepID=A0AAD4MI37_9BILA|nr:hypothetical protein DdX_19936 [Ditylenchus destructor]